MDHVNIELLGTPRVHAGGAPVALPRRRTRALLYYLAAEPQPHSREEIAALLWPDLDPVRARRQLSDALTDLRRTLGNGVIQADTDTVSWAGPPSDVVRLGALLTEANRNPPAAAAGLLVEATTLYNGEFLAGVRIGGSEPFEEWLGDNRLCLNLDALAAFARLARLRLDAGEYPAAVEAATRGLAFDPLREDLWRLLIEASAASGDREGALQHYVRCRDILHRELGVAPEAETEALRRRFSAAPDSPAAGSKESDAARSRPPLPFALRLPPGALPLTGRERDLGALLRCWKVASASGGLALIVGEPGIGKTRLAAEFAARVVAEGAVALGARCPDLAEPPPHGPFEEALRAALAALPQGALASLGEWLPWAGRLLPEVGLGAPIPDHLSPDEERSRLSEAAIRLLEVIASGRPLLLVLEDLHWAHPSTISLLHRLARRDWPAMILGTFRDTEPQTPGSTALLRVAADLAGEHRIERLNLGPLPQQQCESLVRTALSTSGSRVRARPAAVAAMSEGHPLFAIELTRALIEAPDDPDLPETLTTAIRARMERASEQARRVLELAVVFGHPVSPDLLARAAGLDPTDDVLIGAIEELLARRLLKEDAGTSGAISASHGLVTAVVYESLSAPRRRALHSRAATALETTPGLTSGARIEALLRHFRLGGEPARASEWAVKAADRALSLGETDTAVSRLRTAADLHLRAGAEHAAIQALERAGDLGTIAGLVDDAGRSLLTALDVCESLGAGRAEKARLHRKLAELYTRWGYCGPERFQRASKHIDAVLALTEADPTGEDRCRVLSSRSFVRSDERDVEGAEDDARAALALAPHGSPAWLQAMDAICCALMNSDRPQEALASCLERLPVAKQLGDAIEINDAYRMASLAAMRAGKFEDAEEYARLSEGPAVSLGIAGLVRDSRTERAAALLRLERWQDAFDMAEALVTDPGTTTDRIMQPVLRRLILAEACAHLGHVQRARSLISEAKALPGWNPDHFFGWAGEAHDRAVRALEVAEASARVVPTA